MKVFYFIKLAAGCAQYIIVIHNASDCFFLEKSVWHLAESFSGIIICQENIHSVKCQSCYATYSNWSDVDLTNYHQSVCLLVKTPEFQLSSTVCNSNALTWNSIYLIKSTTVFMDSIDTMCIWLITVAVMDQEYVIDSRLLLD